MLGAGLEARVLYVHCTGFCAKQQTRRARMTIYEGFAAVPGRGRRTGPHTHTFRDASTSVRWEIEYSALRGLTHQNCVICVHTRKLTNRFIVASTSFLAHKGGRVIGSGRRGAGAPRADVDEL
ncbi:hypothetical protein EVAR_6444_1 [Eumeta japonica]|uniref:Uncharacterized protein n=1 Tax=Eumeta variegata TaxID=151549 RepID=A0A4C1SQE7_EUMVA|nr:hypothetical protein EVAR_6444_1 [Eumeta japonica]